MLNIILAAVLALFSAQVASTPTIPDQAGCGCHRGVSEYPTIAGGRDRHAATRDSDSDDGGDDGDDSDSDEGEDKWDVNNPPGPHKQVPINVTEGTWMNLDVSPDGKTIIFDMLGDIYSMPIKGGEAVPLTDSLAWDMLPAFSPDGSRIAYTSDAGGGDNIWIMNADGSDPEQVTKEKFRLLTSPAWTPDGQYIVARKHFTSKRSIGAGEMWLYHTTGGEGLQMTKRPTEQKDVGEPALSPDGRYLYYSRDVTGGETFQYNKDSAGVIYAIKRLDRIKGDIDTYISGPGGSIRPTPSPDGQYIAFVRRVQYQSTLFIHDIESGKEWPVYKKLERDMQEAWAIHGVYTRFAWTPDNKSIVIWAKGKIHRVDVATKKAKEIPFHVNHQRTIYEAVRYPVEVHPEESDIKMLRWVTVSPSGDKVVYNALGHLYIRDLPDGTPKRLTRQNDHFEHYPSFSRDGKSIVYTTWNDETLGEIRVVSTTGGASRTVTDKPGHYIEPVFSPDGKTIVYHKISGGYLRSRTWSRDPGIYWVPSEGGVSTLVTKKGSQPQFSTENDRVYLIHVDSGPVEDTRTLFSINLNGSKERTHLTTKKATRFALSPDGKWVAFTEKFNAYIAPFIPTGREVAMGPKSKAIPVRKVSRDAGQFIHFSGDSSRLYWSLGPELFERNLTDTFAFLDGAPEEIPEPAESGRNISFTAKSDMPTGSVAIVGARVITMRGDEVIENATIVVDKNRITHVGPKARITIPEGAHVIDARGMTVMPGWVDVHDHGAHGTNGIIPQQNWARHATLAFGVTTTHDPSNDTNTVFASAELARTGGILAPRVFSTGTILYGAAGWFKADIDSLDDARSHLRRMKAVGAVSVKSYNQPRRNQRQQVIAAARELEMMVVPEGGSLYQHNMSMIADGHTGIEHCLPVENVYDDVLQFWSGSESGYTPTLVVAYGGLSGENYWYQHTDVFDNERLLNFVPRFIIDPRSRRREKAPEYEYNHIAVSRGCKKLLDAGVPSLLGAHGQLAGMAAHWEVWMLEQGGMSPMEAIRAATLNPAKHIGFDADIGSIDVGKLADLVILSANPLEKIRNTERVKYVMLNGRLYDARTLKQVTGDRQTRKPYFWQMEGG